MLERCDKCKKDGAHYTHSDGLGYWHFYCDEHDPRELFQDLRKEREKNKKLIVCIEEFLKLYHKAKEL